VRVIIGSLRNTDVHNIAYSQSTNHVTHNSSLNREPLEQSDVPVRIHFLTDRFTVGQNEAEGKGAKMSVSNQLAEAFKLWYGEVKNFNSNWISGGW
jgi:hypothetical protein